MKLLHYHLKSLVQEMEPQCNLSDLSPFWTCECVSNVGKYFSKCLKISYQQLVLP